jgi:hypothetical protein
VTLAGDWYAWLREIGSGECVKAVLPAGRESHGPTDLDASSPNRRDGRSAKYEAGKPVELEASYWFADGKPLVASHFPPELALSLEQLDAIDPQTRAAVNDSACVDLGMVEGVERLIV